MQGSFATWSGTGGVEWKREATKRTGVLTFRGVGAENMSTIIIFIRIGRNIFLWICFQRHIDLELSLGVWALGMKDHRPQNVP